MSEMFQLCNLGPTLRSSRTAARPLSSWRPETDTWKWWNTFMKEVQSIKISSFDCPVKECMADQAQNIADNYLQLWIGVSIDAASSNRTTPLWEAASNGHIRIVRFLVERGANVNAFDAEGNTPLYVALSREAHMHMQLFMLKLQYGNRWPLVPNNSGSTGSEDWRLNYY